MNAKIIWLSVIAVLISFFGGFYLANSLNGTELAKLRAENEQLKKDVTEKPQPDGELTLTDDEIRQKIAEADKNPENISFQRNLGLALFSYGAMKQNTDLITESARLLQRVFASNPKDYDVIVTLGNAFYDVASIKKDSENFKKAREFYAKALEQKPDDSDVRADYGSTFLFAEPNELDKAGAELQRALQLKATNQRALLFMTQTLLKQNKRDEAAKYHAKLREINPKTPDLAEINAQVLPDASNAGQK